MLEVRKAEKEEFDTIMEVYKIAQEFMINTGNPNQWKRTNPTSEQIKEDIKNGICHVITENNEIHGVFALCEGVDSTYLDIEDGDWLNDEPYVTIHRIASSQRRKGIFTCAMERCKAYAKNIRIDTHNDNMVMKAVLKKHGFQKSGTIYLMNGDPRIAFQWTSN